jgi:hypothetical protein
MLRESGWLAARRLRKRMIRDFAAMQDRHNLNSGTDEPGNLALPESSSRIVFRPKRLRESGDFPVLSSFICFRQPDAGMFQLGLDIGPAPAERVIDNRGKNRL